LSVSPLARVALEEREVDFAQEVMAEVRVLQRVLVWLEGGSDLVLIVVKREQCLSASDAAYALQMVPCSAS